MQNLRFLDLTTNQLQDVPESVAQLSDTLETLLLFRNHISDLPVALFSLGKLKTLWLGSNQIRELPKEILDLRELDWGDQHYNLSTIIDGNFFFFLM